VIAGAVRGGDALFDVVFTVFYRPLLFLFLVALVGTVPSIRKPSCIGWLFCAHACLLACYIMAYYFAEGVLWSMSC
jgi:hypothetical protein